MPLQIGSLYVLSAVGLAPESACRSIRRRKIQPRGVTPSLGPFAPIAVALFQLHWPSAGVASLSNKPSAFGTNSSATTARAVHIGQRPANPSLQLTTRSRGGLLKWHALPGSGPQLSV